MSVVQIYQRAPVTAWLIGLCGLFALASGIGTIEQPVRLFLISEYLRPVLYEVRHGQVWRLLTPVFIHFSLTHLIFNMLWLWYLGVAIETRQQSRRLLLMVIVLGVASNLAELFWSGPVFGGMSGVEFGLLGYVWIQGRFNPAFGVVLPPALVNMFLIWFVICWSGLLESLAGVRIANMAHTAGLLLGMAWGFLTRGERSM